MFKFSWKGWECDAYMLLIAVYGVFPGLCLQTDPLNPLKPIPLGRAMAREQESPTAACTFPQTSSPTLPLQMRGGVMGADGLSPQGVRAQHFSIISFYLLFRPADSILLFLAVSFMNNLPCPPRCLYSENLPKT